MDLFREKLLSKADESIILEAIRRAEDRTSGEIRVHIDKWCKTDPKFKAGNVFHHLKMDETKLRNGVLIYVALKEHKFAIIGDQGINEKVPQGFWESTAEEMTKAFKSGKIGEGIAKGVQEAGDQLAVYFPIQPGDRNELSDEISYG